MKCKKVIICLFLVISMCLSFSVSAFASSIDAQGIANNQYTTVFIHGLMGWGPEDGVNNTVPYFGLSSGSMMQYLKEQGYDVVAASVGPISSCWDRCCELYAQLTGTKTDYGAAHVAKTLSDFQNAGVELGHERFGRDYTGRAIVDNWGPGIDNKLNLVGHSFGGPTSVMFLNLLAKGNEAEREYAKNEAKKNGGNWKDYCSPLFWGDYHGENLINSVTSLAGVLNGTTFINSCETSTQLIMRANALLANTLGDSAMNKLYDFQLEQFGLTKSGNADYKYTLNLIGAYHFLDGKDNAIYDLSIKGCNELKQGWNCYDNVFYFAYAGCTTRQSVMGNQIPNANTWLPLSAFAVFMGKYTNQSQTVLDVNGNPYCVIDKTWLPNDGLVNTVSAEYVFGCNHKAWDGSVTPGIWITMPTNGYDHMDYCGGIIEPTQNSAQTKAFFDDVMNNITATYGYGKRLTAPSLVGSSERFLLKSYVDLSWNQIEGATSYKIYRASLSGGCYSLLATVTECEYQDYSIIKNRTYYYKVVAVKKGASELTGPFSDILTIRVK